MWFMILSTRYESNPERTAWNGSEKFMSVKIYVPTKASVAKLYSGSRRYFAKQREIGLLYLITESRILFLSVAALILNACTLHSYSSWWLLWISHCVKSAQARSFIWSVFTRIQAEYGEIRNLSVFSPNTGK